MSEVEKEGGDASIHQKYQDDIECSNTCNLNPSGISITPSESTQSCIKFEKAVYKTLLNLNNEMSSTLCGGVKDINDVCFKIMECLNDMEKQDRLYQKMRNSHITDATTSEALPLFPVLLPKKSVVSCTTMTSQTSLYDSKTLQVLPNELALSKTQSVETTVASSSDGVVQCSFSFEVPNDFNETQSMQEAFKLCLESFIKDVEEVSMAYMDEVRKDPVIIEEIRSKENLSIVDQKSDGLVDGYVCKCKAVHNLHEKLVKQIDGCDSFCEFQRKMAENLKLINGKKCKNPSKQFCCYHKKLIQNVKKARSKRIMEDKKAARIEDEEQKKKDLALKYNDSLWFTWTPKTKAKQKAQKHNCKWRKSRCLIEGTVIPPPPPPPAATPSQLSEKKDEEKLSSSTSPPSTPPDDSKSQTNTRLLKIGSNLLNCVDILEELTDKDVEPIQSEYPRRDDIPTQPHIQQSFLYQMVYGRTNRNVLEILSSLEPPRINCSLPSCERCILKLTAAAEAAAAATTAKTDTSKTTVTGKKSKKGGASAKKKKSTQNNKVASQHSNFKLNSSVVVKKKSECVTKKKSEIVTKKKGEIVTKKKSEIRKSESTPKRRCEITKSESTQKRKSEITVKKGGEGVSKKASGSSQRKTNDKVNSKIYKN